MPKPRDEKAPPLPDSYRQLEALGRYSDWSPGKLVINRTGPAEYEVIGCTDLDGKDERQQLLDALTDALQTVPQIRDATGWPDTRVRTVLRKYAKDVYWEEMPSGGGRPPMGYRRRLPTDDPQMADPTLSRPPLGGDFFPPGIERDSAERSSSRKARA